MLGQVNLVLEQNYASRETPLLWPFRLRESPSLRSWQWYRGPHIWLGRCFHHPLGYYIRREATHTERRAHERDFGLGGRPHFVPIIAVSET